MSIFLLKYQQEKKYIKIYYDLYPPTIHFPHPTSAKLTEKSSNKGRIRNEVKIETVLLSGREVP